MRILRSSIGFLFLIPSSISLQALYFSLPQSLLTIFRYYDQPFTKLKKRRVASTFCHNSFNCFTLTIDQEGFSPTNGPQQVLTAALALFIFFLVGAIFKNLLSTDKTVEKSPPQIDSIQDLLGNPKFSEYIPVVPSGLWQMDGLMTAHPETIEGKLWAKIIQNKKESIFKWGTSDRQLLEITKTLPDFLLKFSMGQRVLIIDRTLTLMIKQILCRLPPMDLLNESTKLSSWQLIHVASQTFSPGSLHIPISTQTTIGCQKIFRL